MNTKMKDIPESKRPCERLMSLGAGSLSDGELLAVILRTGIPGENSVTLAGRILETLGGTLAGLYRPDEKALRSIKGIGPVKISQLLCIAELSRRISKSALPEQRDFSSPQAVADYYMEALRGLQREELHVLFLNNRNRMIKEKTLSVGTASQSIVPIREILSEALRTDACGVIMVHNHPGGDPSPSGEDIASTESVIKGCRLSGIRFVDHIVIGDRSYKSLRENCPEIFSPAHLP